MQTTTNLSKTKNHKIKLSSKFLALNSCKGFTLVELMVSVTILSVIMLSVFVVYSQIIKTNKKLELSRILQENAKNITETLASEIRNKWVDYRYYGTSTQTINYSWSGNTILAINGNNPYCLKKEWNFCDNSCNNNAAGCYLGKLNEDVVINDDRVNINNLRFFIDGKPKDELTNIDRSGKITILFDLSIADMKWISGELAKDTKIKIQTTINEKMYKK